MAYEFRLPDVGEGIAEAEIVRWLVLEGEHVELDQPIVEIQTDKAVVEVTSPVAGVLVRHGGREGETLRVGDVLVVFDQGNGAAAQRATSGEGTGEEATGNGQQATGPVSSPTPDTRHPTPVARRPLATPAVRKLARDLGIGLAQVPATGPGGRVSAEDVQSFLARNGESQAIGAPPVAVAAAAGRAGPPLQADRVDVEVEQTGPLPASPGADEERVPLRGLRRRIAAAMTQSWRTIPHITGMDELDASALVALRQQLKPRFEASGLHLTYLPFLVKAAVAALQRYPIVNAHLDEAAGEIVYRRRHNIGIATATPDGLIVPVIHDAGSKSLRALQAELADLGEQVRSRRIGLAALQGGTFTITNFGSLGGWLATPIIRPGEAAILGVGRIQERPWAVAGRLEVRPVLALSFSADHRLIDGDVATAFVSAVAGYLADPLSLFVEMA